MMTSWEWVMDQNNCSSTESAAILAVDIGTTNLKCCLFNNELDVINSSTVKVGWDCFIRIEHRLSFDFY